MDQLPREWAGSCIAESSSGPGRRKNTSQQSCLLVQGATATQKAQLDRAEDKYKSIAAFLIYLALSLLLLRGIVSGGNFIGRESDPGMFMWYLGWWRHALEHRVNPFLTDRL